MELGSTFSPHHLRYLGADVFQALEDYSKTGLKWVRLSCNWSEIEKTRGRYDFTEADAIVDFAQKNGLKIIMTLGIKSPRWPEFYIPEWLEKDIELSEGMVIKEADDGILERALKFLDKCLNRYKNVSAIKIWQVENEPMDPAGEFSIKISDGFLEKEIGFVRKADPSRKILVSVWGNKLTRRGVYVKAAELADVVGLNLYLRYPVKRMGIFDTYSGPDDSAGKIKEVISAIRTTGKDVFLTELQAEPWERDGVVTGLAEPPSFLPSHFQGNLEYGSGLGPSIILLWGYEWWYLRKVKNDGRYWSEAIRSIKSFRKPPGGR